MYLCTYRFNRRCKTPENFRKILYYCKNHIIYHTVLYNKVTNSLIVYNNSSNS